MSGGMSHEHHLTVRRTARYFTLGNERGHPEDVWFVCHGYGQLAARFLRRFQVLDDDSRLIVAPEGLSRFYLTMGGERVGASWMTREDRLGEIADYVSYLDAVRDDVLARIAPSDVRCTALGFSQGAATVTRWATHGGRPLARLILWGGYVPPETDLAAHRELLSSLRLTFVLGDTDPQVAPADVEREEARLREAGIPYSLIRFAGGHELEEGVLGELGKG